MKSTRKRVTYHGLNRRVARKLGISDSLVSKVRGGSVPDRQNIMAAARAEQALMRAEQLGGKQ